MTEVEVSTQLQEFQEQNEPLLTNALCKFLMKDRRNYIYKFEMEEYLQNGLINSQVPYEYYMFFNQLPFNTSSTPKFNKEKEFFVERYADIIQEFIVYGYDLTGSTINNNIMLNPLHKSKLDNLTYKFTCIEKDEDGICVIGKITFGKHGLVLVNNPPYHSMKITIECGSLTNVMGKCLYLDTEDRKQLALVK